MISEPKFLKQPGTLRYYMSLAKEGADAPRSSPESTLQGLLRAEAEPARSPNLDVSTNVREPEPAWEAAIHESIKLPEAEELSARKAVLKAVRPLAYSIVEAEQYLDLVLNSAEAAAEQVQDKRLEWQEEGPQTTPEEIVLSLLFTVIVEGPYFAELVKRVAGGVIKVLLRAVALGATRRGSSKLFGDSANRALKQMTAVYGARPSKSPRLQAAWDRRLMQLTAELEEKRARAVASVASKGLATRRDVKNLFDRFQLQEALEKGAVSLAKKVPPAVFAPESIKPVTPTDQQQVGTEKETSKTNGPPSPEQAKMPESQDETPGVTLLRQVAAFRRKSLATLHEFQLDVETSIELGEWEKASEAIAQINAELDTLNERYRSHTEASFADRLVRDFEKVIWINLYPDMLEMKSVAQRYDYITPAAERSILVFKNEKLGDYLLMRMRDENGEPFTSERALKEHLQAMIKEIGEQPQAVPVQGG